MESSSDKKVTLVSIDDGAKVQVSKKSMRLSGFLTNLVETYGDEEEILVPDIHGDMLNNVREFLEHYRDEDPKVVSKPLLEYNIKNTYGEWEEHFIVPFLADRSSIMGLLKIADTLDCKSLLELAASAVAIHIKDLDTKEMMEYLEMKEDLTEEEHKKLIDTLSERRHQERAKIVKEASEEEHTNEDDKYEL